MDSKINLVDSTRLLLLEHIRFVLIIEEFYDRHPRVSVIDVVAEARRIDDG